MNRNVWQNVWKIANVCHSKFVIWIKYVSYVYQIVKEMKHFFNQEENAPVLYLKKNIARFKVC